MFFNYNIKPTKNKDSIIYYLDMLNYNYIYSIGKKLSNIILYLHNTDIVKLPDNLTVEIGLDFKDSTIKALPDNLTIRGSLYLVGTLIKNIPASLIVKGFIYVERGYTIQIPECLINNKRIIWIN